MPRTGGTQANNNSDESAISGDGRYVAFDSTASNLVTGDTNGVQDVFVRDQVSGYTTRVSVNSGGAQANGVSSSPATSADGRYITYQSLASNLVAGDTNSRSDVFVRDRVTGATTRVSVASDVLTPSASMCRRPGSDLSHGCPVAHTMQFAC